MPLGHVHSKATDCRVFTVSPEPACPRGLRLCGMYDIFFQIFKSFPLLMVSAGNHPKVTLSMSEIGLPRR
jgi:hypothetical protein